jgi:hypothetical protein
MTSFELVVSMPASWDDDRVSEVVSVVEEAIDRFPGASVQVRVASPGLLAEVDQLQARMREASARLDRAEADQGRVRGPWRFAGVWAAGFGAGCAVGVAVARLLV